MRVYVKRKMKSGLQMVSKVNEIQLTPFQPRTRERCPYRETGARFPGRSQYAYIQGEGQRERFLHLSCWMHRAVPGPYSLALQERFCPRR